MSLLFVQLLSGLANAMFLFLIASGLTLIFGVTRIVNFAHGSFYMLAAYLTYSLAAALPPAARLAFYAAVAARRGPGAARAAWSRSCCSAASTGRPSSTSSCSPSRWCW